MTTKKIYQDPRYQLPRDQVLRISRQLLFFASKLHAAGIIHGDINPTNLMLGSDGDLQVIDFECANLENPAER
jgi:serine/threonine protein kinase